MMVFIEFKVDQAFQSELYLVYWSALTFLRVDVHSRFTKHS